jgi:hypothetical protein
MWEAVLRDGDMRRGFRVVLRNAAYLFRVMGFGLRVEGLDRVAGRLPISLLAPDAFWTGRNNVPEAQRASCQVRYVENFVYAYGFSCFYAAGDYITLSGALEDWRTTSLPPI